MPSKVNQSNITNHRDWPSVSAAQHQQSVTHPFGKLRGTEWTTLSGSFIMWLRLNPGTNSFFLVDRLRACVVNTRRSFPSRDVCWSSSLLDRAVRSREDPDLHSEVPSIIPRHFFGMFTSRSALRDMPPRQENAGRVNCSNY